MGRQANEQRPVGRYEASEIPWEMLSDAEFWGYFDTRRYRSGDTYLTGKRLKEGDPEIGRLMFPEAREHDREYREDYMLERGEFAWISKLKAGASKLAFELEDVADWEGIEVPPCRWLVDGFFPPAMGADG